MARFHSNSVGSVVARDGLASALRKVPGRGCEILIAPKTMAARQSSLLDRRQGTPTATIVMSRQEFPPIGK